MARLNPALEPGESGRMRGGVHLQARATMDEAERRTSENTEGF